MLNLITDFLNNKQGAVSALKGSLILIIMLSLFGAVFDLSLAFVRREGVKSNMDFANMASYREIDIDRLKRGELYLPSDNAESTFREYLQKNLKLNHNMEPLPGSIAVGEVEILDFQTINMVDTPTTCPLGTDVEDMAVYSEIRIPLNPTFYGVISDVYTFDVAITTDQPHDNPFELYGLVDGEEIDWEPPSVTTETLISQSNNSNVLQQRGSNRDYVGNTFTTNETLTKFEIETYIGVNGSPKGDLEARLYDVTNGLPTTYDLDNAKASDVIRHTSDGWASFEFTEKIQPGRTYAFAVKPTDREDSDMFAFYGTSSSSYSGGNMIYRNNDNWNTSNGDLAFFLKQVKYFYEFARD